MQAKMVHLSFLFIFFKIHLILDGKITEQIF
jgi:hypothetical protein